VPGGRLSKRITASVLLDLAKARPVIRSLSLGDRNMRMRVFEQSFTNVSPSNNSLGRKPSSSARFGPRQQIYGRREYRSRIGTAIPKLHSVYSIITWSNFKFFENFRIRVQYPPRERAQRWNWWSRGGSKLREISTTSCPIVTILDIILRYMIAHG